MTRDQRAEVAWNTRRVPVSTRFDDPYFSLEDGLAETRHTFLAGNNLPARFAPRFHVAELGFGTALNMLATHLPRSPRPRPPRAVSSTPGPAGRGGFRWVTCASR